MVEVSTFENDRWTGDPGRSNSWRSVGVLRDSQAVEFPYWPAESPPRLPVDGFRVGGESYTEANGWWVEGMLRLIKAVDEAEDLPSDVRLAERVAVSDEARDRRLDRRRRRLAELEAYERRLDSNPRRRRLAARLAEIEEQLADLRRQLAVDGFDWADVRERNLRSVP